MKSTTLSFDQYRRLRATNWSSLKELARSPAHYKWRLTHERPDSPAMMIGRAIHAAVLEPEKFAAEFAVFSGARRSGPEWTAFKAAHEDATILKADEYEQVQGVAASVWAHKVARRLMRYGKPEVSLTWNDKETHVRCKSRPDWVRGDLLMDLKSTRDIDARTFGRTAERLGYAGQLAFARRGLAANGAEDGPTYIVAVEQEGPFDVAVFRVPDEVLDAGDAMVSRLLNELVACRRRGKFAGRYEGEAVLDYPVWGLDRDDDISGVGLDLAPKDGGL